MSKIQERKQAVLRFVENYWDEHGISPTILDIVAGLDMPRATVSDYLKYLREDGLITATGHRNIVPVTRRREGKNARSPVYGDVACGQPIFADSNVLEYVNLPMSLFGSGDLYVLRASGQSMDLAGIETGDWVVIRRQEDADPGQIVVALVDDDATLKRYYPEADGKVRLEPESSDVTAEPILVDTDNQTFRIQGVVARVIKNVG